MRVLPRWSRELALTLVVLGMALPTGAWAKPDPNYKPKGFKMFASTLVRFRGNKVQCALQSTGQVCSAVSSTEGGGYWPVGTANQYIFNTGLQIAGRFDPASGLPWAGTTDGAFFFNARGGGNGEGVVYPGSAPGVFDSSNPADLAAWPLAANVPIDPLFDPALQGRKVASDNDIWFLSWEGNPAFLASRNHPLGILVETRGLAYNSPGKTDFLYFIYTIYNVTASNPAVYTAAQGAKRPDMLPVLEQYGARFQSLNENQFGAGTIPDNGYNLQDLFVAFGADMDVTFENSGNNYDGVNVPFAMGYTYEAGFTAPPSWSFDPTIYKPPFFAGSGFVGVKYLKSPVDPNTNLEVGLTLFGATTNGGQFSDPGDTKALFRYLTGTLDPALGDDSCNVGVVAVTHICYINQGTPQDMRFFQASGPLSLAPGESQTIAVAYILAAPVASGACTGPDVCAEVRPQQPSGDLTRLTNPAVLAAGANTVDTITGFDGFLGDLNANGVVDQNEIKTIPGSLLGKAEVAQGVFNAHFVQPSPPGAPPFYLIPGDNSVTIVWQPSATDGATPGSIGDPYYQSAKTPALYDPNYRQFDVEGYRIYRGRAGDAGSLQLLAQFDYANTTFLDSLGIVNQIDATNFTDCAPQLATPVEISCTIVGNQGGLNLIDGLTVDITGNVIQNQVVFESGTRGIVQRSDTAITGGGATRPALNNSGVPFVFVDRAGNCTNCGVNNHQRYFYVVTAFDVNSVNPGAGSSLESSTSLTTAVVPTAPASNVVSSSTLVSDVVGGGVAVDSVITSVPSLDATTGQFSGPFPPADIASAQFVGQFLPNLFSAPDSVLVTLTGLTLGDARNGVPVVMSFHAVGGTDVTNFTLPVQQEAPTDGSANNTLVSSGPFPAAAPDPALAGQYGVPASYRLNAFITTGLTAYQVAVAQGRACIDTIISSCLAWGPRWFTGANENTPNPNAGTVPVPPLTLANLNNAGSLPGVTTIWTPEAYGNVDAGWRTVAAVLGGGARAADFELTWGAGGQIAIKDVTHNVDVPLQTAEVGAGFAVLTQAGSNAAGSRDAKPNLLTVTDWGCVEPFRTIAGGQSTLTCTSAAPFTTGDVVTLGPIGFITGGDYVAATPVLGTNGWSLYLAGHIYLFEMAGAALPAPGTVWKLRNYTGFITGSAGSFAFDPGPSGGPIRPFTAQGASLRILFNASNSKVASTNTTLKTVHTVPDPYYVTNSYENSVDNKIIKFVNLPSHAIIRIYSASGVLIQVLEHRSDTSSEEVWDVRNRGGQFVASGVYFWHVESGSARRIGRMTIVNFAK